MLKTREKQLLYIHCITMTSKNFHKTSKKLPTNFQQTSKLKWKFCGNFQQTSMKLPILIWKFCGNFPQTSNSDLEVLWKFPTNFHLVNGSLMEISNKLPIVVWNVYANVPQTSQICSVNPSDLPSNRRNLY